MRKWRVDTFGNEHRKFFYETEEDAKKFAEMRKAKGKIVFILKETIIDGLYEVVERA